MNSFRLILHIDMDAFFAAIEQLDHPEFRGKPVIVGADPKGGKGRGVVSTCSYEARRFGIHSAMPISRAYHLCPKGIYVFPRMNRYVQLYCIVGNYITCIAKLTFKMKYLASRDLVDFERS